MWILIIYLAGQPFVHQSDHGGRMKDTEFRSAELCEAVAQPIVPAGILYSCARR